MRESDVAILLAAHGERGGRRDNAILRGHAEVLAAQLPDVAVAPGVLSGAPSIEEAVAALRHSGASRLLVYPFFLSDGFFVRVRLAKRLESVAAGWPVHVLGPLGLDPHFPALVARQAHVAAETAKLSPAGACLLLVGHGSARGPIPREAAQRVAAAMQPQLDFHEVRLAFLEEPPFYEDVLKDAPRPLVVLGLLVGEGLHSHEDVATAAEEATGHVVYTGPVGAMPGIGDLMRQALTDVLDASR